VPQSPQFELSSIGLAKEPAYAVQTSPTLWVSAQDFDFHGTTEILARGSARGNVSRELGATGMYTGVGSATIELDPDIAQSILALSLGAESVTPNATVQTAGAAVTTTSPTGVGYLGSQDITPAAMTGITAGMLLRLDSGAKQEDVRVESITATTFRTAPRFTHPPNFTIVQTPLSLAYDHLFTIGSPRSTSTWQWNRRQDTMAYSGNKISSLQISGAPKQILLAKIATQYSTEQKITVPGTPSFSTVYPFRFEDSGNTALVNGLSRADILSYNLTVNTGLIGSEQVFGHGRFTGSSPEGLSMVSGDAMMQFENEDMQEYFWGAKASTSPQSTVQPISFSFFWQGQDYINAAVRYGITFTMPACIITSNPTPGRAGGLLQQNVKFEAYQSVPGASDDLSVKLTNANPALF